ncbi:hypothetical protein [Streptomyces sp. CA-146814]|uniref:hypothetical protein n=1 Tax=Streptomyces sp. CA-146814 TaxID=3240053 RepID=UPI003D93DC65
MNLAPHLTRVGHGTARAARAFWSDIPAKERAARLAALTVACWIVGGVVLAERRALWVLLVAWCLTAWAAGRTDQQHTPSDQHNEEPPGPDPADMADIVRELGTGTGVLLTRLAAQLQDEYEGTTWTTKHVRALLAGAQVRVREGVRVTGVGNGPGVHRDDVPPPLSPAPFGPPVGGVGAGQDANTNANNVSVVRHAHGAHITVTPPRQTTP